MSKPLLVGEMNPYGADPDYALYPLPEHASGGRLQRILGLTRDEYLDKFDRANLCEGKWSMPAARRRATELLNGEHDVYILLGRKVADAFRHPGASPFTTSFSYRSLVVVGDAEALLNPPLVQKVRVYLPHPSGLNRVWNDPHAADEARRLLRLLKVL